MNKSVGAALAVVLFTSCGKPGIPKVMFGIAAQQSPSQIVPYLARDLGLFQAEGLDVQVEEFTGSGKAMEALIGGSLDVVSGYHEQVAGLNPPAPPVRTFHVLTNSQMVALAVSPKAGARIESIADLRGRTVGVTTLGSATHILLNYLLRRNGLDPGS